MLSARISGAAVIPRAPAINKRSSLGQPFEMESRALSSSLQKETSSRRSWCKAPIAANPSSFTCTQPFIYNTIHYYYWNFEFEKKKKKIIKGTRKTKVRMRYKKKTILSPTKFSN